MADLKFLRKGGLALIFSFLIGIIVFFYFVFKLGPSAFEHITENINLFYIILFFLCSFILFLIATWRARIILNAYKKKIPFFLLLKQIIAGYAISYITPGARVGGEPVRIYMLKKEAGIDYRTGSASVLMDKFVEITGIVVFGLVGVILFVFSPEISYSLKIGVAISLIIVSFLLVFFYLRCIAGKGSFSSLFNLFMLNGFPKLKKYFYFIIDVEKKMGNFFIKHKKAFLNSFVVYALYLIISILQMKFLLLGLGVDASFIMIMVSLTFLVVAEIIPVPAALGLLEAGQSAVFSLFSKGGSVGFAVSIFLRISAIFFVSLGFVFLSHFGWKRLEILLRKVFQTSEKNLERG